ncbi:hypothetical protein D3C71_1706700 [compost metagenome]
MIRYNGSQDACDTFDRIKQFLARILWRKHHERKITAPFDQFWQAAAAQLFDVAPALIAAMQPDHERIGFVRTGIVFGRIKQIIDIRRDRGVRPHGLLLGKRKCRCGQCRNSDQA